MVDLFKSIMNDNVRYVKGEKEAKISCSRPVVLITFLLVSCQSFANESKVGIGAVLGGSNGLFVPIQLNTLLIEPAIVFNKSSEESLNIVDLSRSGRKSKTVTIGVGIFKTKPLADKSEIYYGVRIGYIRQKVDEFFESNSSLPSTSSKIKKDGIFVSPTIGVQAFIVPQFSLGIDMAFIVSRTDGVEKITSNGLTVDADSDDTSFALSATVIARYKFD